MANDNVVIDLLNEANKLIDSLGSKWDLKYYSDLDYDMIDTVKYIPFRFDCYHEVVSHLNSKLIPKYKKSIEEFYNKIKNCNSSEDLKEVEYAKNNVDIQTKEISKFMNKQISYAKGSKLLTPVILRLTQPYHFGNVKDVNKFKNKFDSVHKVSESLHNMRFNGKIQVSSDNVESLPNIKKIDDLTLRKLKTYVNILQADIYYFDNMILEKDIQELWDIIGFKVIYKYDSNDSAITFTEVDENGNPV